MDEKRSLDNYTNNFTGKFVYENIQTVLPDRNNQNDLDDEEIFLLEEDWKSNSEFYNNNSNDYSDKNTFSYQHKDNLKNIVKLEKKKKTVKEEKAPTSKKIINILVIIKYYYKIIFNIFYIVICNFVSMLIHLFSIFLLIHLVNF